MDRRSWTFQHVERSHDMRPFRRFPWTSKEQGRTFSKPITVRMHRLTWIRPLRTSISNLRTTLRNAMQWSTAKWPTAMHITTKWNSQVAARIFRKKLFCASIGIVVTWPLFAKPWGSAGTKSDSLYKDAFHLKIFQHGSVLPLHSGS